MTEGNVTEIVEKIESQDDDVAEVREVIENALWDGQALNVVCRAFMGEKLTDADKDLFDEWKFDHSSDDVLALIGKTGTALAAKVKAQAEVIREMSAFIELLEASAAHCDKNRKMTQAQHGLLDMIREYRQGDTEIVEMVRDHIHQDSTARAAIEAVKESK